MFWNREIKSATIAYDGFNSLDYYLPLIRYYGHGNAIQTAICSFSGHLNNPVTRVKGYQGQDKSWNTDFDKAKLTMKKYKKKLDPSTLILFERFINECKSQNIKLIFVYAPEYIEGQKFVKNREEIISKYTKYSKQYHIPFYDYSHDTISYQKKYFTIQITLTKRVSNCLQANLSTHLSNQIL